METLPFLCATITIGCASRAPQAQVRGDCDAPNSAHAAKTNSRLRSRAWQPNIESTGTDFFLLD